MEHRHSVGAGALLGGVRILDLSQNAVGQAATSALADLGADVISISRPGYGADRGHDGLTCVGWNKRSVCLDLKHPTAFTAFQSLVENTDVLVEGFRVGVTTRLGIDFDSVKAMRDGIIYCSISGYGQVGPYAGLPGHDLNYQAVAGALPFSEGRPQFPSNNWADRSASLYAQIAILSALVGRGQLERGLHLDVAIADSILTVDHVLSRSHPSIFRLFNGGPPGSESPGTPFLRGEAPGYALYQCSDDRYVALGCIEPWFWRRLCTLLGRDEWVDAQLVGEPRRSEIKSTIACWFRSRSSDQAFSQLSESNIPASPVNSPDEVANDPHLSNRRAVVEQTLPDGHRMLKVFPPSASSEAKNAAERAAVIGGQDTRTVLRDVGLADEDIDRLVAARAVEELPTSG